MSICYFTVVTRNYLAYADALFQSLIKIENKFEFYCFVVDGLEGDDDELIRDTNFKLLFPSDLNIKNFENMLVYYDAFELCNALKASVMRHIVCDLGYKVGIYLDSDMLVFDSLEPVVEEMRGASFGFSPHYLSPLPQDGNSPDELAFLRAGIYNGGFWIFKQGAAASIILDWLIYVCERYAFNDLKNGMFVDQKLICSAVGIFNKEFCSLNGIGCNVAYWNLHERSIKLCNGHYMVNDESLRLFHYSGYKVGSNTLSIHTDRPPFSVDTSSEISSLFKEYSDLVKGSCLNYTRNIPYRYSEVNGVKLDQFARRYFFNKGSYKTPLIKRILFLFAKYLRALADRIDDRHSFRTILKR